MAKHYNERLTVQTTPRRPVPYGQSRFAILPPSGVGHTAFSVTLDRYPCSHDYCLFIANANSLVVSRIFCKLVCWYYMALGVMVLRSSLTLALPLWASKPTAASQLRQPLPPS